MCKQNGILFPLEGIVNGHHRKDEKRENANYQPTF